MLLLQMTTCMLCRGLRLRAAQHLCLLLCWQAVQQQSLSQATTGKWQAYTAICMHSNKHAEAKGCILFVMWLLVKSGCVWFACECFRAAAPDTAGLQHGPA